MHGRRGGTRRVIGVSARRLAAVGLNRAQACKVTEMTADKIYVDASQPATLRHAGGSVECATLHEAVIAWRELPDKNRPQATIQVRGGPLYTADEIDRLYHEPKPE